MKPLMICLPLILAICGLGCNSTSDSKNENNTVQIDDYSAQLDSLIQTTDPRSFNGVVLITQNGKTQYAAAHGYHHFEEKTPMTLGDKFRIQSNSKQITAVLILQLVEGGKIDLSSPIRTYLPNLDQTWADIVTVHHLLNMSSGIVGIHEPLIFEPGTNYRYSNPAYGLLGRIIEQVTGQTYAEVAHALFQEVEMQHTFCYDYDEGRGTVINGYAQTGNDYRIVDLYELGMTKKGWRDFLPAGGIISNAQDLNIWDTHLHKGKILTPESYQRMITYDIKGRHDAFGADTIGYGYGVRVADKQSPKVIGHAGRGLGFASIKFYIPEKDLDVFVLENVYNDDPSIIYHFEKKIRELVLS
ncbi:MAG: serine hydrolase domain-containing protein, partial [Bacteroidota bacterium]